MKERGATADEVMRTIREGVLFSGFDSRICIRKTFSVKGTRQNKRYRAKRLEVHGVKEKGRMTVLTVSVQYLGEDVDEHHL